MSGYGLKDGAEENDFSSQMYTNSVEMATNNFDQSQCVADFNSRKTGIQDFISTDRITLIKLKKDETAFSSSTEDEKNYSDLSDFCEKIPVSESKCNEYADKNERVEKMNELENYEFNDELSGGNMTVIKVESIGNNVEIVDAVSDIRSSPSAVKQELENLASSTLENEELHSETSNPVCSLQTKLPIFASPALPPPHDRGRKQITTLNIQKAAPGQLPGTPYPHVVARKDQEHIPQIPIPEWTPSKSIDLPQQLQLPQTPHTVNVVFTPSGDSGPFVSSVGSSTSSSSFTSNSSERQDSSSSSVSDFFSPPFTLNTFDVSTDSEGVVQNIIGQNGQQLAHYEDSSGLIQYFIPVVNERENHNVKERKRRSRVSSACSAMRSMVPGMNEKTDKASVFEHAVEYITFLKRKVGMQFDEVYLDKLYQRT